MSDWRSILSWDVLETGPRTLLQDLGRPGYAHLGVGRSGAADRVAYARGQRLLGNRVGAAALEVTLGGFAARTRRACIVAVTGAPAPLTVGGRPMGHDTFVLARDGEEIRLGMAPSGLRAYLSVRGGFDVPETLGSRSTDTMSGLGPAPVAKGDVLQLGTPSGPSPGVDAAPSRPEEHGPLVLRVTPGPRADWLADPATLYGPTWQASDRSDRVGVRLVGEKAAWAPERRGTELPSEMVVPGSIQLPPGGEPVLFLADHPVTGGYPVVGIVREADVALAAQARPGREIKLRLA